MSHVELACVLYDEYNISSFTQDDTIDLELAVANSYAVDKPTFEGVNLLCNMTESVSEEEAQDEVEDEELSDTEDTDDSRSGLVDAQMALDKYCEANYPYGVKLHWFTGCIAKQKKDDGTYFLKVTATITNAYNAKYDTTIEATVDENGNVIKFFAY